MSLLTQLAFLNRCARSACFFFRGVIHTIFQAHLGASYPTMPKLSLLLKLYENLTCARMRPAAISLNYSIKDIRHDARQIIYIIIYHEKSQLNRLVWSSLMLAPIIRLKSSIPAGFCKLNHHWSLFQRKLCILD